MPIENSDEQQLKVLMIKAQEGDKEAYCELLKKLNQLIISYCRRSLPSEQTAEDCCQEVLISIHRVRHTYDPTRSFYGWIYAITKNKIIDYYRESGRLRANEVINSDQVALSGAPGGQGRSEAQITLQTVLAELSEDFRKPLILSKIYGFSTQEIAKQLDISESLVKIRIFRALQKLKDLLEKDEDYAVTK